MVDDVPASPAAPGRALPAASDPSTGDRGVPGAGLVVATTEALRRSPVRPGFRLRRAIERSQRFRCDSAVGRILHAGSASYRELTPFDAVHITLDGNRLSVHVDDVSPLRQARGGMTKYSWARVAVHSWCAFEADCRRRLRGRDGEHRCNLDCEVVWIDDEGDRVIEVRCEEAACPTCSDEKTFPQPAVGRE